MSDLATTVTANRTCRRALATSDTLLRSLREHLLDESEPLAGLLRKCLLLGAETGSQALGEWARRELNGYADEDEVPEYRKFHDVPISMDSVSGRFWRQGDIIGRLNLPPARPSSRTIRWFLLRPSRFGLSAHVRTMANDQD